MPTFMLIKHIRCNGSAMVFIAQCFVKCNKENNIVMRSNLLGSGIAQARLLIFIVQMKPLEKRKSFLTFILIFNHSQHLHRRIFKTEHLCWINVLAIFKTAAHISVHAIEGSDRMQEHLLKSHSPSQLHLANCIKSLLICGLFEETVSFRNHPNFVGSGRNI